MVNKIKVALFGFGKTGKIVAQNLYEDDKFDLVFVIKKNINKVKLKKFNFLIESTNKINELLHEFKPDVIIDLTSPEAVLQNINQIEDNTGYIIPVTGFTKPQMKILKDRKNLKLIYAPNISDGINIVIKACELINHLWNHSDVEIIEQHFKKKKDAPSGTAKKIAKIFKDDVTIHSIRAGGIIGVHEVVLATKNQKITIKHESFNREAFADGVKKAAIWLQDKPCGFYEIEQVYNF